MADEPVFQSLCWWPEEMPPAERARRAVESQKLICELPSETTRRDKDLFNIRLYENDPGVTLYTFAGKYYADSGSVEMTPPEQSTNNKAKAAIDTLASQIASTNQRARFSTVGGNADQHCRTSEMQNFSDGLSHELKLHRLKKRVFYDAAILQSGKGAIQFYRDGDRCAAQRALATEFAMNPLDGLVDGQWRTLYRRRPVPRDAVMADFGVDDRSKAVIANAKEIAVGGAPGDYIEVFESWHLPTKKGGKDGWHIVALDFADGWLDVSPHTRPYHDVVFFGIEDRFTTGWGLSLMTQARKLQCRINANDYRAERAMKLFHAGHLYVNRSLKMDKAKLTNEIGSVWEGTGDVGPKQIVFQPVNPQLLEQIERDGQRIFENLGIPQGASKGETALGANAPAVAMREEKQKGADRNADRQQRYEDFHLDCMRVALAIVRDIVTTNDKGQKRSEAGGYKVASPGKRGLTVADWKKAAMDEEDYVMQIRAASPIPTDPGGLVAMGREMVDMGAWTPEQFAGYMQDLDQDSRTNRVQSQERGLEKKFESLLYDKTAAAMPDEFTNLTLALKIGSEYLDQGEDDGVSEKNLERVRRYLKKCKAMQKAAMAAMQPPPAPGGAAPPAGAPVPPA